MHHGCVDNACTQYRSYARRYKSRHVMSRHVCIHVYHINIRFLFRACQHIIVSDRHGVLLPQVTLAHKLLAQFPKNEPFKRAKKRQQPPLASNAEESSMQNRFVSFSCEPALRPQKGTSREILVDLSANSKDPLNFSTQPCPSDVLGI